MLRDELGRSSVCWNGHSFFALHLWFYLCVRYVDHRFLRLGLVMVQLMFDGEMWTLRIDSSFRNYASRFHEGR